jgi:hypothetical protein
MNNPLWEQAAMRGFEDGTETGATAKADPNTGWTQTVDENFQIRFLIKETNAADSSNTGIQHRLQHNYNSTGWLSTVPGATYAIINNSANLTHGDDTTTGANRLGSGTFVTDNNWICDTAGFTNASGSTGFSNSEADGLWSVQIVGADVTDGLTIQFRVVEADLTVFNNYVVASQKDITIDKPGAATSIIDFERGHAGFARGVGVGVD